MDTIDIFAWGRWNSVWVMWNSTRFKLINRQHFFIQKGMQNFKGLLNS